MARNQRPTGVREGGLREEPEAPRSRDPLQTEYALWTRDVEEGILAPCRDLGIAFVAYSPLGRGVLTGAIPNREALDEKDWRRDNPRFSDEALAEIRHRLPRVTAGARY